MAHFAQLDENNMVTAVIVINNADIGDLPFPESESVGIDYINTFLPGKTWKQTSYNGNFRGMYASVGCMYSSQNDAFVPVPTYPQDGNQYVWDSGSDAWVLPIINLTPASSGTP